MNVPYSNLFHAASKDNTGPDGVPIPMDPREWPEAWDKTYFKDYPRLEKIELPHQAPRADFFALAKKRRSGRDYAGRPISKSQLSAILEYSCGIIEETAGHVTRRAQPSGGALYPIEAYPLLLAQGGEIPAGLYHYNVKGHALDTLWQRSFTGEDIGNLFPYEYVKAASAVIIMTALFGRTQIKYGERGYRYALLEAGHIGQSIYLSSQAVGMQCSATGMFDRNLEKLIDIDGQTESVVYAIALG